MLKTAINSVLKKFDYKISNNFIEKEFLSDPVFLKFYEKCSPYSMSSIERMRCLYESVHYIVQNRLAGDYVECGVWRGGSSMMAILTLLHLKDTSRHIYLYDTYEGMSAPTQKDVDVKGRSAETLLSREDKFAGNNNWCYASLEDVRNNILDLGYPSDRIHFIQGKVEDTIPHQVPAKIALLRLDTDWYESTKHEMIHLFPLLVEKGVLILDDYGHWQGARKAVDEYFAEIGTSLMLHRIDYCGRVSTK